MRKITLFFVLSFFILNLKSNEKGSEEEKKYTEEEFKKSVRAEVDTYIQRVKSKTVSSLLKEVLDKEEALEKRERQIAQREALLVEYQKDLEVNLKDFESKQKKVLGCIEEKENNKLLRVSKVVQMMEKMKADKAAEILSVQKEEIAVQILEKMDTVKMSKIFNKMDKEVSARLQKSYLTMQK